MNNADERRMIPLVEAADRLGVTRETVRRWVLQGLFPGAYKKPGQTGPYIIPEDELDSLPKRLLGGPVAAAPASRTPFALIVEDNVDAQMVFEIMLRDAGFVNVVTVNSTAAANRWLEAMAQAAVLPVVILDLHLPQKPGTEIVGRIRSDPRLANARIVVATAHQEMAEEVQDQVDQVLLKPILRDTFQQAIERILMPRG